MPAEDAAGLRLMNSDTARIGVMVELLLAKSALVTGDAAGLRAAVARARAQLTAAFATDDDAGRQALLALDVLLATPAQEDWPAIGRALSELRNLRATRAMAGVSDSAANRKRAP